MEARLGGKRFQNWARWARLNAAYCFFTRILLPGWFLTSASRLVAFPKPVPAITTLGIQGSNKVRCELALPFRKHLSKLLADGRVTCLRPGAFSTHSFSSPLLPVRACLWWTSWPKSHPWSLLSQACHRPRRTQVDYAQNLQRREKRGGGGGFRKMHTEDGGVTIASHGVGLQGLAKRADVDRLQPTINALHIVICKETSKQNFASIFAAQHRNVSLPKRHRYIKA